MHQLSTSVLKLSFLHVPSRKLQSSLHPSSEHTPFLHDPCPLTKVQRLPTEPLQAQAREVVSGAPWPRGTWSDPPVVHVATSVLALARGRIPGPARDTRRGPADAVGASRADAVGPRRGALDADAAAVLHLQGNSVSVCHHGKR